MASAWRQTDSIRERSRPDPHRFWDGVPIEGKKLIVRCLHGFGDTIQMLRYVPDLLRLAERVVLEVQPRLLPLLAVLSITHSDRLHLVTWGDEVPETIPAWDSQVEVMELPYLFRTEQKDLPLASSYVQIPDRERNVVSEAMGPCFRPRVGLVWTAGAWNPDRAMSLEILKPLLRAPVDFWSLVDLRHHPESLFLASAVNLKNSTQFGEGILHLASVITHLDLVITTDTLAAHLAGAIGIPVWLMVQHAADWRWMTGDRSPWYPTMRLFRQPSPGDWGGVVRAVEEVLCARWPN